LFGCFLRKEEEGFGGVGTTSNPSFLIPPNWRDLKGEWSIKMLNQMNYQIRPYYINKITNENINYSLPLYIILKTSKQGGGYSFSSILFSITLLPSTLLYFPLSQNFRT